MTCKKCGAESNGAVKFCGQCGAMLEESLEQIPEESSEQALETPSEQSSEVPPEQISEVPLEQVPEVPSEQIPEVPSEQATESVSEGAKPDKKPLGIIVGIATVLVAAIVGFILFSGANVADDMRNQLEELNSNSYSEIREWLEVDFEEYFDEYFDLRIRAIDADDWFLEDGFLDDEDRFIRWNFTIDEEREELSIELIYSVLSLSEKLEQQLEELDPNSLADIIEWLEKAEAEHGDDIYTLVVWQEDPEGMPISPDFVDMEYEDLFEGWTFGTQYVPGGLSVRINLVFNTARIFELGDTFEFDGLEITFDETIRWSIIDNEASFHFGMEYFQIPLTLTNISDTIIADFLFTVYSPDDSWPFYLAGTGSLGDFTRLQEFLPGESQRGYLFIEFDGDGDYRIRIHDWPAPIVLTVPIDSSDFQEEREALLAAIEPDEDDDSLEEVLTRRWIDGLGETLQVFGEAETVEFREDGTVLIIENGAERTETWELGESDLFGIDTIVVDGIEFLVVVDDIVLVLMDEDGYVKGWIRERE